MLIGVVIGLVAGIYLGFVIQQMILIAGLVEFGEALEGTNIEINVDINETKLIEGFSEVFNETITNINFSEGGENGK